MKQQGRPLEVGLAERLGKIGSGAEFSRSTQIKLTGREISNITALPERFGGDESKGRWQPQRVPHLALPRKALLRG